MHLTTAWYDMNMWHADDKSNYQFDIQIISYTKIY